MRRLATQLSLRQNGLSSWSKSSILSSLRYSEHSLPISANFTRQAEDHDDGHESTCRQSFPFDLDRISDISLVADWDSNAESKSISDSVSQFSLAQSEDVNSHASSGKVAWLDAGSDD